MTRRRAGAWHTAKAAAGGFGAGVLLTAILMLAWGGGPYAPNPAAESEDCGPGVLDNAAAAVASDRADRDNRRAPWSATELPRISADPIADLRGRNLALPVENYDRSKLYGSFNEKRGSSRTHEAIDILAPRQTAVVAVEDGTIAKLFTSKAGGITIYQFDPTMTFVYYYAHLERYATGLADGAAIRRGQVLGYVGTSGNAPPDTPHLHFAIFRLTDKKQWWDGTAIDPYEVLR